MLINKFRLIFNIFELLYITTYDEPRRVVLHIEAIFGIEKNCLYSINLKIALKYLKYF